MVIRMLRKLFNSNGHRSFSESTIWRNLEKSKPSEPEKSFESQKSPKIDFIPGAFDKKVLVWSGRFKSEESIPNRISFETLENARSRFRIRMANLMIVGTIIMCGFYVWIGKKNVKEGKSINKMYWEKKRKTLTETQNES